ncbi:MAG: 2-dehydro-3-deoxygalactonokinase [Paracoccaceae bacterium]
MNETAWIAVDWGTSHLRAWRMSADDRAIEKRYSDAGMVGLERDQFEPALEALIGSVNVPVIACGMVGSRQGWAEAPYETVPCRPPDASRATVVGNVRILPGIRQLNPEDVMRGEETQIAGFLAAHPDFDGVVCLPGTHTKWVHVSAGEIVSFRTAMTGELFGLLSTASVLRHSLDASWSEDAFCAAVNDAMSKPEMLAVRLFNIRAHGLLNNAQAGEARARLSGALIGAELAATRVYWLGQAVAIVGEAELTKIYTTALGVQHVQVLQADGDEMTLRGLIAAKSAMELI